MSHFADQKKPQTRNVWLQAFPMGWLSTDRAKLTSTDRRDSCVPLITPDM